MKRNLKLVARMGRMLLDSLISILFILYFIGIYGVIRAIKEKNEVDCNFYTFITVMNTILISLTVYLLINLIF